MDRNNNIFGASDYIAGDLTNRLLQLGKYDPSVKEVQAKVKVNVKQGIKDTGKSIGTWNYVNQLLQGAGLPNNLIPWSAALSLYETNYLQNGPARNGNNFSNIVYTKNSPYQAGPGYKQSKGAGGNTFARYSTPEDWAKDFKRVLSLHLHGPAAIDASGWSDFFRRLKVNRYYDQDEATYKNNVYKLLGAMQAAPQTMENLQSIDASIKADDTTFDLGEWIKANPGKSAGIAVVSVLGLAAIFRH